MLPACSGSDDTAEGKRPATTVTTTAPTSTTTAEPAATSVSSGVPLTRCSTAQLQGRLEHSEQLMNQPSFYFSLTNTGAACSLNGYPDIQLIDAAGKAVQNDERRGGGYISADPGPREVALATGAKAWFAISAVAICTGISAPDPALSSAVVVVPPDQATPTRIAARIPHCPGEPVAVSAIAAAESDLEPR